MKEAELIFVPSPIPGHLLSTLEFAKRLIDQDDRIRITILLMKLPFVAHSDSYIRSLVASWAGIQLVDLPELEDPPSPEILTNSVVGYIDAFVLKNVPLVKSILSSRTHSVGLVLDFFCVSIFDVASEAGLPSYVFFPSNAGFLALFQYLPERHRRISSEFDYNSDDGLLIPGIANPVPTRVLPSSLFNKDGGYDDFVKLAQRFVDAEGILVNTFSELEQHSMDHFLRGQNYPPVYPVGPVLDLTAHPQPDLDLAQREEVMKWLDDQPQASVVFLCFGSMGSFRAPQVKEIARGLEISGYRFLWSHRAHPSSNESPEDLFPEGFLGRVKGRGMICGWAPQVEVLAHKAVGGFVSHCGWNSILESMWFGVPILTWPMYAEQQLNAFRMVKEFGLAVELRLDYSVDVGETEMANQTVMADEIERTVRCLMESGSAVRKKAKQMSEMARKAVTNGGSSFLATKRFIKNVIGTRF